MPPDRGSVTLRGDDLDALGERRLLEFRRMNGFVFQDGALWENKSIFDNLALPLQVHYAELGEAEIRARVLQMLARAASRTRRRFDRRSSRAASARSRRSCGRPSPIRAWCFSTSPPSPSTTP